MNVNGRGTMPLQTGPLSKQASASAPASVQTEAQATGGTSDSVNVSKAATAQLSGASGFPQKFTGMALYGTDKSTGGDDTQINKALSSFVADFKKLSPAQQKAMLANPNFSITVQGHASNLGNASDFDNDALSASRAMNTSAYVQSYLKNNGINVPSSKIHSVGNGTPGTPAKPVDNNDQTDRSASLEINAPAVQQAAPPPAPKPTPRPEAFVDIPSNFSSEPLKKQKAGAGKPLVFVDLPSNLSSEEKKQKSQAGKPMVFRDLP